MKNWIKRFWPILAIFTVWLLFSYPFFLQGKAPFPATYQLDSFSPWSAYGVYKGPIKNGAMPDIITQIFPWKYFTIDMLKKGQIALWNPYSFSGTPHLANDQSAVLSPLNLIFLLFSFVDAWSIMILLQTLFAGLFMYIFMKSIRISDTGSLIASVSFMFCGFITTWLSYGTLAYAILFLPLALFSIEKYFQSGKNGFLLLLAFTFPLSFFSGHFQTSINFFIITFLYIFYKSIISKNATLILPIVIASICGMFLSLPQILPSLELYSSSLRSSLFQKLEIIPWSYLPTLIAPDFFGNPVTRNDWFGHYAEWNAYIGVLPLMLAFYSIKNIKNHQTIFFIILAIIGFLFSFSTPILSAIVFFHVPVLSTSAASREMIIFSFAGVVLSGIGFDILRKDIQHKRIAPFLVLFLFFLAFILMLWIIVLLKLFLPLDKTFIARQNLMFPTALFIGVICAIAIGIIQNKKFKIHLPQLSSFLMLVILILDMIRFATKWQPFDPKQLIFPQTPIVKFYQKVMDERILGSFGAENGVYYHLMLTDGYDPLYPKRYGEFITGIAVGTVSEGGRSAVTFPHEGKYAKPALNLLGVKYLFHKDSDAHNVWEYPFWLYPLEYPTIYDDSQYQVLENKSSFPRAFFASSYAVLKDPQAIMDTMFSEKTNLQDTVILEKDPGVKLTQGSVEKEDFTPNSISFNVRAPGDGLLFLSNTYYPGWNAFADGTKTEILRADFDFDGILVPKGTKEVRLIYQPESFKSGLYGALLGVIGLVLLVFVPGRKRKLLFPNK